VNVADLDKVASRTSRGSSKKVRLYSAGRLYYRKGLISLLRIIRRLIEDRVTNFDLQMFGSGPLERALRSYIRRKGIARYVTIRGHVPREILIREFADSDIMCFPSLYEACPLAMIEAMAMGKPVVAFDLPFAREILGDDSEPLLARDIVDFSNKVAYLIDSKRERTRLGRMLARRAKAYDVRRTATAYRAIYEELVS
jgi:glycosyltransferase involved in cell wall biosynthesis